MDPVSLQGKFLLWLYIAYIGQKHLKLKLNLEALTRKIGHRLRNIQMGMNFFENVDDEKSGTRNMSGSKPIFCNKKSDVYDNTLNCIMDYYNGLYY